MKIHNKRFQRRLHGHLNPYVILFVMLTCFMMAIIPKADAQTIIRDTEIENILREWSEPVIRAADMSPEQVNFILIQNPGLNAFVAGGPNIFLYTGLFEAADEPDEIIGVIAHELGHIRGGHLVKAYGAIEDASYESLIGTLLGIGAVVLTGEGQLGAAISAGAQGAALNRFLAFSRVQESSADQAALQFLEGAKMSPKGLVSFMEKLENQELLPSSQQSEYVRTHPLTSDRIQALNAGRDRSAFKGQALPANWNEQFARLKAKLTAYITPEQVAWDYGSQDQSIAAHYARAISAYRMNEVDRAISLTQSLIKKEIRNPYFWELYGQVLLDFGKVKEAADAYEKSLSIEDDAPLIRIAYAHALIESNDKTKLEPAIINLQRASKDEPRSTRIQRLLATAYGKQGKNSLAQLHLAEEAYLKGNLGYAQDRAKVALNGLEENSPAWLRAQDILNYASQLQEKRNEDNRQRQRLGFEYHAQEYINEHGNEHTHNHEH